MSAAEMPPPETTAPDAKAPPIVIPMLCDWHRSDLIRRQLKIPETGPWMVNDLTARLLLFSRVVGDSRVVARTEANARDLSLVLAEIGCLACWDRRGYRLAVHLLRKGVDLAAKVATGEAEDPQWPRVSSGPHPPT